MTHFSARHIREVAPNRLADIRKMVRYFYHLRIVTEQQAPIAFHVFLDRRRNACRIFEGATMCDDLMPSLHEGHRIIGANVAVDEKQDFHLSASV